MTVHCEWNNISTGTVSLLCTSCTGRQPTEKAISQLLLLHIRHACCLMSVICKDVYVRYNSYAEHTHTHTHTTCRWCIGRVYINVLCWVVFMIHYARYLFVLLFIERNITRRDAIKAWLVFDTVCVVEKMSTLSVPLCISDERRRRRKWTHFICLTIVLFPDSPAPGQDKKNKEDY